MIFVEQKFVPVHKNQTENKVNENAATYCSWQMKHRFKRKKGSVSYEGKGLSCKDWEQFSHLINKLWN